MATSKTLLLGFPIIDTHTHPWKCMQVQGKTINKTNPETRIQAFKTSETFDYSSKGSDWIMVFFYIMVSIFLYEFYPQSGLHSVFENTKFLTLKINFLVTSWKFKQPHEQGKVLKKGTNLRIKSKFWHWMPQEAIQPWQTTFSHSGQKTHLIVQRVSYHSWTVESWTVTFIFLAYVI